MASKIGNCFTYAEKYFDALSKIQDENMKMKINWDICYYGTHNKTLPEDAHPLSASYIEMISALVDGSIDYREQQQERAKKGRHGEFSDEQIESAISALYQTNRKIPSEKAIVDYLGGSASIRNREPWKNRDKICSEFKQTLTNIPNKETNVINKTNEMNTTFMF